MKIWIVLAIIAMACTAQAKEYKLINEDAKSEDSARVAVIDTVEVVSVNELLVRRAQAVGMIARQQEIISDIDTALVAVRLEAAKATIKAVDPVE